MPILLDSDQKTASENINTVKAYIFLHWVATYKNCKPQKFED